MSLSRAAKGTAQAFFDIVPANSVSLASVAISEQATVEVEVVAGTTFGGVSGITWNSLALTLDRAQTNVAGVTTEVWSRHGCSAATGTVVATMTNSANSSLLMAVNQIAGDSALVTDKVASAMGLGTAPSSGATATTAAADEILIGVVGQLQGLANVGGSWDNSFSDGQSIKDDGAGTLALNDGYRVVSATGAYTASKTGATSAQWAAVIVTYRQAATAWTKSLSDTITMSDAVGKSVKKAIADSISMTDMVGTAGQVVKGLADTVSVTDDLGKGITKVLADTVTMADALNETRIGYYPGQAAALLVGSDPDPWGGSPVTVQKTIYAVADSGLRACGQPYFAATQQNLASSLGINDQETVMLLVLALQSLPQQLASLDEPHYLASWHEASPLGRELFSLGLTPSGRICAKTVDSPVVLSPPALVLPDGKPHLISLEMKPGPTIALGLDGVIVATYSSGLGPQGPFSPTGQPVQFMLFNGIEGKTRCACIIHECQVKPAIPQAIRWPVNEGHGLSLRDQEYVAISASVREWRDRQGLTAFDGFQRTYTDYYPVDWRLTVDWYDPLTYGYPQAWGPIPSSPINSCARWDLATAYGRQNPSTPGYQQEIL